MPYQPVLPTVEKDTGGKKGVETPESVDTVSRLINEEDERRDASLPLVGKPVYGGVPLQQPPPSAGQQNDDYSTLFSQLISVGYRPSRGVLRDPQGQRGGPVHLARTWLAALFIRLLRIHPQNIH